MVDAPLPEPLSRGFALFRYRTENLQILPVFGAQALDVSPRIGHLHVAVEARRGFGPTPAADLSLSLVFLRDAQSRDYARQHKPSASRSKRRRQFVIPEKKAAK